MSRHTHTVTKEGKTFQVAYGYDRPLQEYFLQVEDLSKDEDDQLILWLGSRMTKTSNSKMLEAYHEWQVPEHICSLLAMDLQF